MFTWVLLDGFLCGFSKFQFIIVEICTLIWYFWVIFKNYSMHMLSICGNDFIAHWAYEETISSHTEHTPNEFLRMLIQRKNVNSFYMYSYAAHTGKWFYSTLSIRGNDFLHPEHMRKCLKVEYLCRIEYDFQKSLVTGPGDLKDSVSAKKVFKKISCLCTLTKECFAMHIFFNWWIWKKTILFSGF
jgi:hypothetical protein